jgi:hypothetical protein
MALATPDSFFDIAILNNKLRIVKTPQWQCVLFMEILNAAEPPTGYIGWQRREATDMPWNESGLGSGGDFTKVYNYPLLRSFFAGYGGGSARKHLDISSLFE